MNQFNRDLKSSIASAFGIAALTSFARSTVQVVSQIADMSKQLGISAESMQELEYAAKLSGSSIEAIATAFKALSKARAEAMQDSKSKAAQAFSAMGIGPDELKANSLEQTFKRVAEVFKTTNFGADELTVVSEILGRSGAELLPMFKSGIEEAAEEFRRLGLGINNGVTSEIDEAGDAIDRVIKKLRVPMANAVVFLADRFRDLWQFMDLAVGGAGAAIGSVMGGGSAWSGFADHANEVMQRRVDEDTKKAFELEQKLNAGGEKADERQQAVINWQKSGGGAAKSQRTSAGMAIQSDQFQRIGAFTGVSAQAAQNETLRRQLTVLEQLRSELTRRGILIRGTD
jgi:hypothetical protein